MQVNIGFNAVEWSEAIDWVVRLLPILIPIILVQLILVLTAVVSLARKPNPWNEKILWLVLVLAVNTIGPIIYFAVGANFLNQKHAEREDGEDEQR
ncbi:MAG: PLD nuclease N-terminal domain-containing protein [Defluviitaleaceae bacterium]|nr:PLD nuclease N-terminal domain-containing protein [Defluviitaleaceae bacterium]